jgi:Protein of unknown function (DUF4238)
MSSEAVYPPSMPSRARSQHYIPKFHLSHFIGLPFRRFHVYDKKWGKYGRPPVATSAVSQDYYLVPGATVEDRLTLERNFALLENEVAPLMNWLAQCIPGQIRIADVQRDALAGYIAILHIRVPAFRGPAASRALFMARDPESLGLADPVAFRTSVRGIGIAGTEEEIEAQRLALIADVETGRKTFRIHPAASLAMGLTTAVGKVRPMLFDRAWELLRVDGWPGFVLGDQPVALLGNGRLAGDVGFGTAGVQVMMPLSPDTLLLISDRPREQSLEMKVQPWRLGLREPWWATANQVAWLTSQRYVFGQRKIHLQATEALIEEGDRRRDIRVMSPEVEAAAMARYHAGRRVARSER